MNPHSHDMVVFATAKAAPGKEKELEAALRKVAGPTRAQPGSVAFRLYRAVHEPGTLVAVERWASREHHERHLQGEHVRALMAVMGDLLAEPPQIVEFEIIDEA